MKKYLSFILAISLVFSCISFSSYAIAYDNGEFNLDDYDVIPVYSSVALSNDTTEELESTSSAYAVTREAIDALSLKESGYAYIEEACLQELSSWEEQGYELESYAVLIPKATAQPTYYGTYSNVDFYTATTSLGKYNIRKEHVTNKDRIQAFIDGAINFTFTLIPGGNEAVEAASYVWTIMATIKGWPTTHVVISRASLDAKANCLVTNRAFYIKSLGIYQNVYNIEFGRAHFYFEYTHCNPDWRPSAFIFEGDDFEYKDPVDSQKDAILADSFNVYTSGLPAITYKFSDKISIKLK